MFPLERLGHVILALDHGTVEGWLDCTGIRLLKQNIVTNKNVGHPVDTGNVFVDTVQVVAEDVADVAADVGGKYPDVMFRETHTGDVIRQGDGHSVLVLLGKTEVLPEIFLQALLLVLLLSAVDAVDLVVAPGDVLGQTGEGGELFAAAADDLASNAQDDAVVAPDQIIQPLQRPHSCSQPREFDLQRKVL